MKLKKFFVVLSCMLSFVISAPVWADTTVTTGQDLNANINGAGSSTVVNNPSTSSGASIGNIAPSTTSGSSLQFEQTTNYTGDNTSISLPTQQLIQSGTGPQLFINLPHEHTMSNLITLIKYHPVWTRDEFKKMAKGGKVEVLSPNLSWGEMADKYPEKIRVIFISPKMDAGIRYLTPMSAIATNGKTDLYQVFGKMGLEATGDVMLLESQGADQFLDTSGFTISAGYTAYSIGNNNSNVAGFGIGYGKGKAQYKSNPFLKAQVFQLSKGATLALEEIKQPATIKKAQNEKEFHIVLKVEEADKHAPEAGTTAKENAATEKK